MSISGAVLSKSGVLCDHYFSCNLANIQNDDSHRRDVAIAVMSLRNGVNELRSYYLALPSKPEPAIDGFPYLRKVSYKQRIGRSFAFKATWNSISVIVKFCRRYSKEAHVACRGSPELFDFQKV